MNSRTMILWASVLLSPGLQSQTELMGVRCFANDDEYLPPIVTPADVVTIEFDVAASQPPDIRAIFYHTSVDWVIDENPFVMDPVHARSLPFAVDPAPNGVSRYRFHYHADFPDRFDRIRLAQSGNYIVRLVDAGNGDRVLGETAFILVDPLIHPSIVISRFQYPDYAAPFNERLAVAVTVDIPPDTSTDPDARLLDSDVRIVDVIQNWRIDAPFRIDRENRTPDTFVDGIPTKHMVFSNRNVWPGNEYRRLDIGSAKLYPNGQPVHLLGGAESVRDLYKPAIDANGAAKVRIFTGVNSDYLDVLFRLKLPNPIARTIVLAGAFNGWFPDTSWVMKYDPNTHEYSRTALIRRGVFDYQYVAGTVDSGTGTIVDQDWLTLEGNDWRTVSRYTAIVYYHDERFGGFDRAVGMVSAKSPGKKVSTEGETQ